MEDIQTVADLLDAWVDFKVGDFAPTTMTVVRNALTKLKAEFGPISVDALKPRHIDAWVTRLRAEGYRVAFIRRIATTLSTAYETGLRWEIVDRNPCRLAQASAQRGGQGEGAHDIERQARTGGREADAVALRIPARAGGHGSTQE